LVADFHFPPTSRSELQLSRDGVKKNTILVTGNTGIDALRIALDIINKKQHFILDSLLEKLLEKCREKKIILVTGHRRESFGAGLENICKGIKTIVDSHDDAVVVYPMHLNPNVRDPVTKILGNHDRIFLIEPVGYPQFVYLLKISYVILTDSGGIQEEAPFLGKPLLVMRDLTERPEGLEAGAALLVGTGANKIVEQCSKLLRDNAVYASMAKKRTIYGDGFAAHRIVNSIIENFSHHL
jgi:UDP-N-acetylglucosamine 2-epimerase (non-hydrolysing)